MLFLEVRIKGAVTELCFGVVFLLHYPPPPHTLVGSILLFTEVAHHSPVGLRYGKPFTVSWSDVDVDSAEVVVFLVTWRSTISFVTAQVRIPQTPRNRPLLEACAGEITWYPAPGDLHVELNGVHAQDGVAHVAEQVAG